jgi:beta-galactosidase/beta-glucuronidase
MNPVTTSRRLTLLLLLILATLTAHAQRQRISLDANWRFALGNAIDSSKDFGFDNGELFFYSKAGHGNGPAGPHFDDRAWQPVNLPHDWAVSLPFDSRGDENHGSKVIGHNFPEHSIGWYRRSFMLAPSDEGKRIRIDFDGVYRDAEVWLNGFYIGTEPSGYESFGYDVTDYLNYDSPNTLVVRVDASQQEGWFYEGVGIYRHVWLTKTAPIHIAHDGTFVVSNIDDPLSAHPNAQLSAAVTVSNDRRPARRPRQVNPRPRLFQRRRSRALAERQVAWNEEDAAELSSGVASRLHPRNLTCNGLRFSRLRDRPR